MGIHHLSADQRRTLFESVAALPGPALPGPVLPDVIEKDAWVCFLLGRIVALPLLQREAREPAVVFKGGTSLSKAYGLIHRFSEDLDLTLDPRLFGESLDGLDGATRSQQEKRLDRLQARLEEYVRDDLRGALEADLGSVLGGGDWIHLAPDVPGELRFSYPRAVQPGGTYLLGFIRLEFGARTDRDPWEPRAFDSYAATARPQAGIEHPVRVPTLLAERTFWEKATILHAEAARSRREAPDGRRADRLSRHASDLATMAVSGAAQAAIADEGLLRRVCACKQSRFRTPHVNYNDVSRSNIELVPPESLGRWLAEDYARMQPMFFTRPPPWSSVLEALAMLQARIRTAAGG